MATVHRPADPKSPSSVASAQFSTARRGYATEEVSALLSDVAAELDRLQARETELLAELDQLRAERDGSSEQLDEATAARLVDEETLRVLQTARESASQIKVRAEEGAARILRDAAEQADQIRIDAQKSAQDIRAAATTDAASEVDQAREQGREMVEEARVYRERVLTETARRRDAAQAQIQRLLDARDHLLGVYDRAREAAARVVDEVEGLSAQPPVESPVDLSSVTGQVDVVGDGVTDDAAVDAPDDMVDDVVADGLGYLEEITTATDPDPDAAEVAAAESIETTEATDDAEQPAVALYDVDAEDVDAADETAADVEAVENPDAGVESGGEVVDDLFAKLRAAQTDQSADEPAAPADDAVDEPAGDGGDEVDGAGNDAAPQCFADRDAALQPLVTKAARRAKRALADEQNTLLALLAEISGEIVADEVLIGEDEHVDRYLEAMTPEILVAAQAGAASVSAELSDDVDLSTMRELIRQGLVIPMRERLARTMVDGSEKPDAVMRQVRAVYREWKTQHMNDEVTDVLALAYGTGVLAAVPAGTPMCWMVDPNGPACPDAEDNSLAGSVAAGETYPTGHRLAPAHPGCRCVLVRAEA